MLPNHVRETEALKEQLRPAAFSVTEYGVVLDSALQLTFKKLPAECWYSTRLSTVI